MTFGRGVGFYFRVAELLLFGVRGKSGSPSKSLGAFGFASATGNDLFDRNRCGNQHIFEFSFRLRKIAG